MTYTYTELTLPLGGKIIQRTDEDDNLAFIPEDPANSDYQRYLLSLEPSND
jgi:hypothetical protein